jgi:hypothetical protein
MGGMAVPLLHQNCGACGTILPHWAILCPTWKVDKVIVKRNIISFIIAQQEILHTNLTERFSCPMHYFLEWPNVSLGRSFITLQEKKPLQVQKHAGRLTAERAAGRYRCGDNSGPAGFDRQLEGGFNT